MASKNPLSRRPLRALHAILENPQWVTQVQHLDAQILARWINHVGLEDSSEILALATAEQIKKVFDLDLWKNPRPGEKETFDDRRFATWLEILTELGPAFTVHHLLDWDTDFLVMALSSLIWVIDMDSLAIQMSQPSGANDLLEKALESELHHEFEGFRLFSRQPLVWDTLLSVLLEMDRLHHRELSHLLERLQILSAEQIEEQGGLYEVLTSEEQVFDDVAFEREKRRTQEGYVNPQDARSFLGLCLVIPEAELRQQKEEDPMTRSYFRQQNPSLLESKHPSTGDFQSFLLRLTQEGVLSSPAPVLSSSDGPGDFPLVRNRLESLAHSKPESHAQHMAELNYLANVLVSGVAFEGRRLTPAEAGQAVLATCQLGLELLGPEDSPSLVTAFQLAYQTLSLRVRRPCALALAKNLESLEFSQDPWIQKQCRQLGLLLRRKYSHSPPWKGGDDLSTLDFLGAPEKTKRWGELIEEIPRMGGRWISGQTQIQQVEDSLKNPKNFF